MKTNIFDLIGAFYVGGDDYYLNINNGQILEEYDYVCLDDEHKENCIMIPKYTFELLQKTIKKFYKKIKNSEYDEIIREQMKKGEYYSEIIFRILEDNGLMWKFRKFQYNELKKIAIDFCIKNNISYFEKIYTVSKEEIYKKVMKSDPGREKYYGEKIAKILKEPKYKYAKEDTMIIGFEINSKSSYKTILYNLLKKMNYNKYKWMIAEQDIIDSSDKSKKFQLELSTEELGKIFNKDEKYNIKKLNIRAYLDNFDNKDIETYNDFAESSCELIILFSNNGFIEIYIKSEDLKNKIIETLEEKKIEYDFKTQLIDERTSMHI